MSLDAVLRREGLLEGVVALLAVANVLLPLWLSGFITGLALAGITTYWVCSYLSPTSSHENTEKQRTPPAQPIEIHEPPAVFQAWMNLLPHQFQPYDVDTYEVRNTVSGGLGRPYTKISTLKHSMK